MRNHPIAMEGCTPWKAISRSRPSRPTLPFIIPTVFGTLALFMILSCPAKGQSAAKITDIYSRNNLVAWCIVPFDSENRTPVERSKMLNDLGITKLAYDWRARHIPTFDEELNSLKKYHIKLQAFWLPTGPDPAHDTTIQLILRLLKRHHEKTQLWCMVSGIPGLDTMTQDQKVRAVSKPVAYLAKEARKIGCTVGLYNHGGWFGEPENQLAIIDYLKMPNIGIVYNFSHSGYQIHRFSHFYPRILSHLLCINITGLVDGYPAREVPIGKGDMEVNLMRIIHESDYRGPIGIINEIFAPDAKVGLQMNLEGLKDVLKEMDDLRALTTYE